MRLYYEGAIIAAWFMLTGNILLVQGELGYIYVLYRRMYSMKHMTSETYGVSYGLRTMVV